MHNLVNHLIHNIDEVVEYPISIVNDICTLTMKIANARIPVYITTTTKGYSKCYLNVGTELNDFLTNGLGFRLIFKMDTT